METATLTKKVIVSNEMGLHARPAAQIAHIASRFSSALKLRKINARGEADCRSVLSLLMLAASKGVEIEIVATGEDAPAAVEALADYFNTSFGEA